LQSGLGKAGQLGHLQVDLHHFELVHGLQLFVYAEQCW
jgi:hypothetical protein